MHLVQCNVSIRGGGVAPLPSSSMSTLCASRRASCGVSGRAGTIQCTWLCGKAILNLPDPIREPGLLATLPRLPRDEGGPVFAEPWQATAFALAVRLSVRGYFAWQEWTEALSQELKADELRGERADGSNYYYYCWLTALERLVIEKGLSDPASLLECKEAWANAYQHTPHGEPVKLQNRSGV